jgi:hypothetical protein
MSALNPFPFVAGAYRARSLNFDAQRTVNLYPEASGSGTSKSIAMLIGTPGTVSWNGGVGGVGPVRGTFRFSATLMIAVIANNVVFYDTSAAATGNATVIPGTGPVSMASNGIVVMLVTGANGFIINPAGLTVTPIADPDFHGADVVYFIDGYFVFNWPGTQKYQITDLYSSAIPALGFASAEGAPDLLLSLIVDHKEIWLLGETTVEVHFNSGNADFPFEPIQGAFMEQGCAAKFSVAKIIDANGTGTIIFLSANESGQGMFVRSVGYQLQRISNHALELEIATYSRIDDAIAYAYQMEGHSFYVVSFPTANKTWCYDMSTELWHERAWRNPATGALERHRSNCHVFFAGKHLVGDYLDSSISYFDLDTYGDRSQGSFLETMVSIRQCPHLSDGDDWMIIDELWIDMETGVGLNADRLMNGSSTGAVGKDPQILLEWSIDGGHTFPFSRFIAMGKLGERQVRAIARRLGKGRDWVFRVTVTDPVKRCFINAGTRRRAA